MKNKKTSNANYFLTSIVLVFVLLLGLSSVLFYTTYKKTIESQVTLIDAKVEAIKEYTENIIDEVCLIFNYLIDDTFSLKGLGSFSLDQKMELLQKTYFTLVQSASISIFDFSGKLIKTSNFLEADIIDLKTASYFNEIEKDLDTEFFILPPEKSLFKNTLVFSIVKKIKNLDFDSCCYLVFEFEVQTLENMQKVIVSESEASFILATKEGIPLVISGVKDAEYQNKPFFLDSTLEKIHESPTSSFYEKNLSQNHAYFSFVWTNNYPLFVVGEYALSDIFAGWKKTTFVYFGFLGVLLLILIVLTIIVLNQFSQLHQLSLDLTNKKKAVEFLTLKDPLTGVSNRASCLDRLANILEISKRYGNQYVGILYLGINNFKIINEKYGYKTGDLVLKEFANRLLIRLRVSDTIARMTGDEFLIIAPQVSSTTQIDHIANKIFKFMKEPVFVEEKSFLLSLSIGTAISMNPNSTSDSLVSEAEKTMKKAKPN